MIAAEGEEKSSRALKGAADLIEKSPIALQLRYLQVPELIQFYLGSCDCICNCTFVLFFSISNKQIWMEQMLTTVPNVNNRAG